ncbi:MAG: helix-turn-helix domain-containing protein, partial [Thermoplasmata archaeon]|nr:helix-turn-helix domain-containing protein [Thermoplasmata archaeon]
EAGLFDVPSRTSWAAVARREGLSRSTFGEHLRKGQLRLLSNSYESLRSRALGKEAPIVLSSTAPDRTRRAPLRGTRTAGAGEAWAAAKPRDPDPAMRRPPINPRRSAPTRRR